MHRTLLSAAVALTLATAPLVHASAAPTRARAGVPASVDTTTQLPRGVVPTHYPVSLTPDAAAASLNASRPTTAGIGSPASTRRWSPG